jgi:hypothetical protein
MAVRVKIRVRSRESNKEQTLVVLVNGGAESLRPLIAVDRETASKLCFKDLSRGEVYEIAEASSIKQASIFPQAVILELLDDEEKILSTITADLAVEEGIIEPLITDVTIDALGIEVISFGKGLWRHVRDPVEIIRRSSQPL